MQSKAEPSSKKFRGEPVIADYEQLDAIT